MELNTTLIILISVSIVAVITISAFLVKLLYDLSKLAQSATSVSETLQNELEPTLKELREASSTLNSITGVASEQIINANRAIGKVLDATSMIGNKVQGLFGGFLNGIKMGYKLFSRKK